MTTKRICESASEAVADIGDGASLLVHSFGPPQAWPTDCRLALAERGVKDLTVICNTPAGGPTSLNILADKRQIKKLICSYVGSPSFPTPISEMVKAGELISKWSRKGPWWNVCVLVEPAELDSIRRPASAPRSPTAKSNASSTAGRISSSAPSGQTARYCKRTRPTRLVTRRIGAACEISAPPSPPLRRRRLPK
jgi:Coenzyme A transferase